MGDGGEDADDHDDDDKEYDELLSILLKRKCQSEKAKAQFSSASRGRHPKVALGTMACFRRGTRR